MPAFTSEQIAALRADGHQMEVYLSVLVGAAVLVGALSATPAAESALNLSYTTTSGSSASVKRGARVTLETSGGAYKGTLSVRFAGTISSTNLPVREVSAGSVDIESGDVIRVYNDIVLTDRLVAATETFDPDWESYVDQNGDVKPAVRSGGWWAGFLDDGQTYATIALDGSESEAMDEDSGGSLTHLWTLPSGVAFAPGSGSTDASPTVRADAGYALIQHEVTDSDNSKTEVQYVPIRVHDRSANAPYEVTLDSPISGDAARGFGFSMALYANVGLTALPDLVPVVLWARELNNGSVQSFGHKVSGRSHIVCTGYLRRETTALDGSGANDAVRFEVISPLARLAELPGFSKAMTRDATPAAWSEIEALTIKRAIFQLARYYTNAPQVVDVAFDDFDDADYPELYLQKKAPIEQIAELADSRGGRLAADQTGRIEVQQRLDLTALASRSGVTTTFTLTAGDVLELEIEREHIRPVETHYARGFTAGVAVTDAQPVFAKWAASPGTGGQSGTTERLIVDDVDDLYAQTAMRGAAEDRVFVDANGLLYHAPRVTVTLPGAYWGVFRFYREYVLLDFDETTNPREIDLTIFRFIPVSAELELAGGSGQVRVVLQAATYATGAVDDTPVPEVTPPDYPPIDYPPGTPVNPPRDDSGLAALPVDLAALNTDGSLYLITGANALRGGGTPSAVGYALGLTGTPQDFVVRADSPLYVNGSGAVNGHILTSTRYYSIADIVGARTLSNETTLSASDSIKTMQFERGNPNWGIIAWYTYEDGVIIRYTTDGGATWSSEIVVNANYNETPTTSIPPGLWLDPTGSGTARVSVYTNTETAEAVTTAVYKTTNYGATWALDSLGIDPGDLLAAGIVASVADTSRFYTTRSNAAILSYDPRLYRNTADISPSLAGDYYGMNTLNRSFSAADDDPNVGVLCGLSNYSGSGARAVFRTYNLRASPPTWTQLTSTNIADARRAYCVSRLAYYLIGADGWLAYVGDGSTVNEAQISGASEFVGLCGV